MLVSRTPAASGLTQSGGPTTARLEAAAASVFAAVLQTGGLVRGDQIHHAVPKAKTAHRGIWTDCVEVRSSIASECRERIRAHFKASSASTTPEEQSVCRSGSFSVLAHYSLPDKRERVIDSARQINDYRGTALALEPLLKPERT